MAAPDGCLAGVRRHSLPDQLWSGFSRAGISTGLKAATLVLCLPLAACSSFPDVANFSDDDGTFPALQPLDTLLAKQGPPMSDPGPALAGRAAGLKMRAAATDAR